jgi:electron transport complex protein RnfD
MIDTVHSPLGTPTATVATTMRRVLLALSPGIIIYTAFFGWGLLIQLMLASATALALEAIMLKIRKRPVIPHLTDYSALVTAWLLAICLPPLLPWWMTVLAVGFAIVIAKHLYGGLGSNPFNPAMVGYAVLLVSFPREMTQWLPQENGYQLPGFADSLSITLGMDFARMAGRRTVAGVQGHPGLAHSVVTAADRCPVFNRLDARYR